MNDLKKEEERKFEIELQKQAILLDAISQAQLEFIAHRRSNHCEAIFNELLKALCLVIQADLGFLYILENQTLRLYAASSEDKVEVPLEFLYRALVSDHPKIEILNQSIGSISLLNGLAIPLIENQKKVGLVAFFNHSEGFIPNHALEILPATQSIVQLLAFMETEKFENRQHRELIVKEQQAKELLRKLELQNLELQEAKRKADEARMGQSAFLANVSHEIRTPLNAIIGLSELILNQPLEDKPKKYAHTIYQASETLLALINDLLDLSKIEAGHLGIEVTHFNLFELIQEVVLLFHTKALEKGLSLNLYYNPLLPMGVQGDPIRIRQVIMNLLANAIKFTEVGYILLICNPLRRVEDKLVIEFIVADSGIGIPQDKFDAVFERFHQLDNSLTRRYSGTGLGLAISKLLVEKMGGSIEVKSALSKGSSFCVQLPLRCEEEKGPFYPELAGLKVLLIGHDSLRNFILSDYLKFFSMEVESFVHFREGFTALQQDRFLDQKISAVIYDMTKFSLSDLDSIELLVKECGLYNVTAFCIGWESSVDNLIGDKGELFVHLIPRPTSPIDLAHEIHEGLLRTKRRRI